MSNGIGDVQQTLANEDPHFRECLEEHGRCEQRLLELSAKTEVSTDEELEEKTLKKRKLQLKDQMYQKMRTWESSRATA